MKRTAVLAAAVALVTAVAGPAQAAHHHRRGAVTLDAAPHVVDFGQAIDLSGTIDPAAAGEHVLIKTTQGDTVASADTDAGGSYSATFEPDHNVTIHAEWNADSSTSIDIGVHAVVKVSLSDVRLFGKALVTGTVAPAVGGANVDVKLVLGTKTVSTAHPSMSAGGSFHASFAIGDIGKYHAVATFSDATHLPGSAASASRLTPTPGLHVGSNGPSVLLLETRLASLDYHLTGVNQGFDNRTADAVMAFRKVQGMARTDSVDDAVWRTLAHPKIPQPVYRSKSTHIEVDKGRQVLYVVSHSEITDILHVSTGKPSTPTPDGNYRVYRKLAGISGGGLVWPSYWHDNYAIHGWPDVPSYAASHGCIRVPIWSAKWIYGIAKMGMRVRIYA